MHHACFFGHAGEALAFAPEQTPKDKQQPLLELRAKPGGKQGMHSHAKAARHEGVAGGLREGPQN